MRTIRDFLCEDCGSLNERFVDSATRSIECPDCGGPANEQLSMPTVRLEGISGDFPDAHDRWARIREENARIKAKRS